MDGRILTPEERAFCTAVGLEHGHDDPDNGKHQFSHICWPFVLCWGALCKSKELLLAGGGWDGLRGDGSRVEEDDTVDCVACLDAFESVKAGDARLLAAIGGIVEALRQEANLADAANDLLWALDHPEEYDAMRVRSPESYRGRADYDEAKAAHDDWWKKRVEVGGAPREVVRPKAAR